MWETLAAVNEAAEMSLGPITLRNPDFAYPTGHWVLLMNFK